MTVRDLSPKKIETLARSPILDGLKALCMESAPPIGDAIAQALASSFYLTRLTSLMLMDIGIGPVGAKTLAKSPYLKQLTSLSSIGLDCTTSTTFGNDGVRALAPAESDHMVNLTCPSLPVNGITIEGVRALAASSCPSDLTYLDLTWNLIGPEGVRALVSSAFLTKLTHLQGLEKQIGRGVVKAGAR